MRRSDRVRAIAFMPMLVSLLLSSACSNLPQDQLESIAENFISTHVKFFASDGAQKEDVPAVVIGLIDFYKESDGMWYGFYHVTATRLNETKSADITITLDGSGKVLTFNGQSVPDS